MEEKHFTTKDTAIIKGIAACLLLWHHLFYNRLDVGLMVGGINLTHQLALLAKVCVALFLLLSGYGLTQGLKDKPLHVPTFYKKRFSKLYGVYWLIYVVFVLLGVFIFNRPLRVIYRTDIWLRALEDLLGLSAFLGFRSYNDSWWFVSLILLLYALYPLIHTAVRKYGFWALLLPFGLMFVHITTDVGVLLDFIPVWVFPFCLGVWLSEKDVLLKLGRMWPGRTFIKFAAYIACIVVLAVQRQKGVGINDIRLDAFFALAIVLFAWEFIAPIKLFAKPLAFIGQHSFNIFLIHTFVYGVFFHQFFSGLKIPLLSFGLLLGSCLVLSMGITWLQQGISRGLKSIRQGLTKKPVGDNI